MIILSALILFNIFANIGVVIKPTIPPINAIEITKIYFSTTISFLLTGKDKTNEVATIEKESPVVESQSTSEQSQNTEQSTTTEVVKEASDSLSKDEITAVKAALNNKNNKANQSDIPDYLK